VEPTREELAVLERQRRAFITGDRELWLSAVDPNLVSEFLRDWPGVLRVESAAAAWDEYQGFFEPFETFALEYRNIERSGQFTVIDVRVELVGRASGAPMELLWTIVGEFDPMSQRFTRTMRWFHTRDEATAATIESNEATKQV
jgi:hypothetical protein